MQFSDQFLRAIDHYFDGTASEEEKELVNKWYQSYDDAVVNVDFAEPGYEQLIESRLKHRIQKSIGIGVPKKRRLFIPRVAAAAAVVMVVFGAWLYSSRYFVNSKAVSVIYANDIAPGKNAATLTLASGEVINLSDKKTGVVIDASSLKYSDGGNVEGIELRVANLNKDRGAGKGDLTVRTPMGGTYQVVLPDGTKVWLNAASKISFPFKFSGAERRILLSGEAYFEVATSYTSLQGRQTKQSFIVESRGQEIQVLGTHFNVKSYDDEAAVKTTLLEGSIKLSSSKGHEEILKPGEQAINNGSIKVDKADLEEAIAWKNGSIVFRDKALSEIMQDLSRWYDVTVVYAADAPKYFTFSGAVSRTRNISAVLEGMQTTRSVKFKIEGRIVTVMK